MAGMSRAEHIEWCKKRALALLNEGNHQEAVASIISDLGKHQDTAASQDLFGMMMMATVKDEASARKFIEGFR